MRTTIYYHDAPNRNLHMTIDTGQTVEQVVALCVKEWNLPANDIYKLTVETGRRAFLILTSDKVLGPGKFELINIGTNV